MRAHVMEQVIPPSQVCAWLPPDLETVVLRCLEKDAEKRFANVGEMEQALAQCACADLWTNRAAEKWWSDAVEPQPSEPENARDNGKQ